MRLAFAGTPEFARASLAALLAAGHRPVCVLTQPDRPAGRGRRLRASPVKALALEEGLGLEQPPTLRSAAAVELLAGLDLDVLVVAAYGLLLPPEVLALPRRGCLNVHASLLPRWRGAAPVQAAILAGDERTGVCLMEMERGLDTGPVYACRELGIGADETAGELHDRLAPAGGELLAAKLEAIVSGELAPVPQDEARATYAPRIAREDALVDWRKPATALAREVRAYDPWPVSHTLLEGRNLRLWRAAALPAGTGLAPGTVAAAGRDGIDVAAGEGTLRVLELQLAGRRRIAAADFSHQRPLTGLRLG